jgi:hypothetical protein
MVVYAFDPCQELSEDDAAAFARARFSELRAAVLAQLRAAGYTSATTSAFGDLDEASRFLLWEPLPHTPERGALADFTDGHVGPPPANPTGGARGRYVVERAGLRQRRFLVKLNGAVVDASVRLTTLALGQQAAQKHYERTRGIVS